MSINEEPLNLHVSNLLLYHPCTCLHTKNFINCEGVRFGPSFDMEWPYLEPTCNISCLQKQASSKIPTLSKAVCSSIHFKYQICKSSDLGTKFGAIPMIQTKVLAPFINVFIFCSYAQLPSRNIHSDKMFYDNASDWTIANCKTDDVNQQCTNIWPLRKKSAI
jgi:hypothetical protein